MSLPASDLVSRNWAREGPDRLWVAHITFVPTREGWLYLAFVLDAYSRRVVGWAMAGHIRAELVVDALTLAVSRRNPTSDLVHHCDHGRQYTSIEFGSALGEAGILPTMGSIGSPHDNAMAESFVATLKTELLDRRPWHTRDAARGAVFEYVECFYNPLRRHSALGYLSPIEYERSMMTSATAA